MISDKKIKELAFNWSDENTYYFKEHELFDFAYLMFKEFQKLSEANCKEEIVAISKRDFIRANSVLMHEDQNPLVILSIKEK